MNTPRNLTAFAALGFSLALGAGTATAATQATATASAPQSTAYGNWQVTEMRAGAEMDQPYCAMSNYFSNDVLLVMSKNADGTGSIALDFNSNRLSLDKKYPVSIDIGHKVQYSFDAFPGNRQALVMELDDADELFLPMAKYPDITFSLANTHMAFDLGTFVSGLNDMNGCLSALTGQTVAAVDVSQITVAGADDAPGTAGVAPSPMAGVAQAMWKSQPGATDAPDAAAANNPLPGLRTAKAMPEYTAPQHVTPGGVHVMSSNATDLGIDLGAVYQEQAAMQQPDAAVAVQDEAPMAQSQAQPMDLQQIADSNIAPDMMETQAMPAAGDEMPMSADSAADSSADTAEIKGEVKDSIVFSTNRKKDTQPAPVVITAGQKKPMAASIDGEVTAREDEIQNNYEAMRSQQVGEPAATAQTTPEGGFVQTMSQPTSVADLGDAHGAGGLLVTQPLDPVSYQQMREKFRSPVYEMRGVGVPLAQAIEQISPRGYTIAALDGVNTQVPVSWNGGRPWRVLLDDLLEPLGYSAIVTENKITLAAKKN